MNIYNNLGIDHIIFAIPLGYNPYQIVGIINDINNTINNITNNNNNTYNIIVYKPNGNDTMEFITDHITKNDFKSLFIDNPSEKELVENYARHLLSNPMNQCIKKTNTKINRFILFSKCSCVISF